MKLTEVLDLNEQQMREGLHPSEESKASGKVRALVTELGSLLPNYKPQIKYPDVVQRQHHAVLEKIFMFYPENQESIAPRMSVAIYPRRVFVMVSYSKALADNAQRIMEQRSKLGSVRRASTDPALSEYTLSVDKADLL